MNDRHIAAGFFYAAITVLIWGTTYIATKTLLRTFAPHELLLLRFALAYAILWVVHPRLPVLRSLRDELFFFSLGLTGITLYFSLEFTALKFSYASNIGFIVSTNPMITALIAGCLSREERFGLRQWLCTLLSLAGVFLILTNGYFNLKLNPLGDLLALCCACVWGVYSLLSGRLAGDYGRLLVVRKTFFYGLLTMVPLVFWQAPNLHRFTSGLTLPVLLCLLYLACFASILCFVLWNMAIARIGAVRTCTFIYCVPLITMTSSALVLKERLTPLMFAGGFLILTGLYLFQRLSLQSQPTANPKPTSPEQQATSDGKTVSLRN